jgi:hypothetical protein
MLQLPTLHTLRLEAGTRAPTMIIDDHCSDLPPDHGLGGASLTNGKESKLGHEPVRVREPDAALGICV